MLWWRSGPGLVGALLPVAYCAGLVWYFADMGGWDNPLISQELRPTILGLAIIGLVFVIVFGFRLRRLFGSSGPPDDGTGDGDAPDADAMIARYLAERAAPQPRPLPPVGPKPPATFGRRR